jgi:hypothetical protein
MSGHPISSWVRRNADLIATGLILLAMGFGSAAGRGLGQLNEKWLWQPQSFQPRVMEMPRWGAPVWRFKMMKAPALEMKQEVQYEMRQNLGHIRCTTEQARRQMQVQMVRLRNDVRSALSQGQCIR